MRKHGIATAMRPHSTLRKALVHPKDKIQKEDKCGVVYRVPCKNCDKVYIGETGRKLGTRIGEHQKDVNDNTPKTLTRSSKQSTEHIINKSAITDHAVKNNHIIDWEGASSR